MVIKRHSIGAYLILLVIFLVSLFCRLEIAGDYPPIDDQSYFNLRQAEYIKDNHSHMFYDKLSYSGRNILFLPFFHYILAAFSYFGPTVKIGLLLTSILGASLVIPVFLVSERVAKDTESSIMAALLAGFIPVVLLETTARINVYSLVIVLVAWLIYFFLHHQKKWARYCFFLLIIMFTFTHPTVLVFLFGLAIYCLLAYLEDLSIKKTEIELIVFSLVFVLWADLLIFKRLLLFHGQTIIWQNIPDSILNLYFAQISVLQVGYLVGIIPFFAGIFITYRYLFRLHHKPMHVLIGFALSTGLLLFLKLIELEVGLLFFSLALSMLFPKWFARFKRFIKTTRTPHPNLFVTSFVLILLVVTTIIPAIRLTQESIMDSKINSKVRALEWINQYTPSKSVIFGPLEYGNMITAIGNRKNVLDSQFTFVPDANKRVENHDFIFSTISNTAAIEALEKYGATHILTEEDLPFLEDDCFSKEFDELIEVYSIRCHIERES